LGASLAPARTAFLGLHMKDRPVFRVATYNTHKCRGMDGRIRPHRIADVLRELDADVIALQEVVSLSGGKREQNQAQYLADAVGFEFRIGETRKLRGAAYGNVVLSRFKVKEAEVYDLTASRRERRGCIRCDLEVAPGKIVHLFNIHLGTGYLERRKQAHLLMSREVLRAPELKHPRLVVGDFNEWTRGLVSRALQHEFESVDIELHLRRRRTYPGVLPIMHLDHMYFDRGLALETFLLHRTRAALMASDHLPLVAEFRLER
jgi:endonuclease/exonuclease/phosphatase family metal-dependent hydrolase